MNISNITADFFLDWSLPNWQQIYKNQTNLLQFKLESFEHKLPQVLSFDNTKEQLQPEQIYFKFNSEKPTISSSLENEMLFDLYQKIIENQKRQLFNGNCLRLKSLNYSLLPEKRLVLEVQEIDYFSYLKTNLMLDARPKDNEFSLREKIHQIENNHQLEPLETSPLANILGINILVFTQDKNIILQQRSATTLIRPNEICSSGSGTMTREDLSLSLEEDNLIKISLTTILRELFEEIGIDTSHIIDNKIEFLGITRELIRGGIPEMFWSTCVNITTNELKAIYKNRKNKYESKNLLVLFLSQAESISTHPLIAFLERYNSLISQPLCVPDCNYLRVGLQSSALSDRIICNYKLPLGQN